MARSLGFSLGDILAMEWTDLIAWWGEARAIIEGHEED